MENMRKTCSHVNVEAGSALLERTSRERWCDRDRLKCIRPCLDSPLGQCYRIRMHKNFFWPLVLIIVLILPGCFSPQRMVTEKASSLFQDVALSAGRQSDVALVRNGTPAYLMLIDG